MTKPRSSPRARRRLKVVVADATSFTVDISRGGFSNESMRVLPAGTLVRGTLHAGAKQIPFSGRVAWSKSGNLRVNVRGRMGIAFDEIIDELKDVTGG